MTNPDKLAIYHSQLTPQTDKISVDFFRKVEPSSEMSYNLEKLCSITMDYRDYLAARLVMV